MKSKQSSSDVEEENNSVYDETEINGKFKITSEHWSENLNDPNSEDYKLMSKTITRGIMELLESKQLTDQADFNVTIVGFK